MQSNPSLLLEEDPRLAVKISHMPGRWRIVDFLRDARNYARVDFYTDDSEVRSFVNDIGCVNVPLYRLMDGVAGLSGLRWRKTSEGAYKLLPSNTTNEFFNPAKLPLHRQRMNDAGLRYLDSVEKLNPKLKKRILSGEMIPMSDMPESMYQSALDIAQNVEFNTRETLPPNATIEAAADAARETFRVGIKKRNDGSDFDNFKFDVETGNGITVSYTVTGYPRYRDAMKKSGTDPLTTDPVTMEISRAEAMQALPGMRQPVALKLPDATAIDAMRVLSERFQVPYVAIERRYLPRRAAVDIPRMPLGDALKRLETIFPEIEWEARRSGFIDLRKSRRK